MLNVIFGFSQKESANWYFGNFAGLDFNTGTPVPLRDGKLITKEGCMSISDVNGNLLFYSDGITVWDRRHEVMPNGYGLLGHVSSTESALVVPKPGSRLLYYIFTIDRPSYFLSPEDPIDGVNFTEIDMSLNNGYGDVVVSTKNTHLVTYDVNDSEQSEFKSSEKISAVTHSNGSFVWVVTQFVNKFYAFKVDYNGVDKSPVISSIKEKVDVLINDGDINISAIGYMKIAPNGGRIAIAHSSTSLGSPRSGRKASGKVLLYNFDNSTGSVSNEKLVLNNNYPYGVEFSPNSKLLYITVNEFDNNDRFIRSFLNQYNLESSNIRNSLKVINTSNNVAGALQLALDAKIYRAGYQLFKKGFDISVINSPNKIGLSCNYAHNSVNLGGPDTQIGLPVFVQSIFLASFEYEDTCLGDQTHFYITSDEAYQSAYWDFGDGFTSTEEEPYHTYLQSGVYTVSLTLTINGIDLEPFLKEVIVTKPVDVMQSTLDLVQCDSFDNNPNDGITTFNLQQANAPLTFNTQEAIQVYYYGSIAEAEADIGNNYALNNTYENQYQNELLYAKVFNINTDCYSLATIRLVTVQSVDLGLNQLNACVPVGDIYGDFDLLGKGENIIEALGLSTNISVTFHEREEEAEIGINALPAVYNSVDKTIYIRAENNNACYGIGKLVLNVKGFPRLEDKFVNVCSFNFPITIDSGISPSQIENYGYSWNSVMDATSEISVYQPGDYKVVVTDPVLKCGKMVTISVKQNGIAEIKELVTNNRSVTVLLHSSDEKFIYALDDENSIYQESNVFLNLAPGLHRVYISDVDKCFSVSERFYIFGFPKYFTPNGDGNNDTWNAFGLKSSDFGDELVVIKVFDRYGKLLKVFDPINSTGWNGRYNGKLLSVDDYWYHVKVADGKTYTGHFTLKL